MAWSYLCFSQYIDYVHPYWLLYRPYHGVLLLEEKQVLQDSLPMDCSPSLSRLITVCSPQQSLQVLSQEADLTLSQVKFTLSLVKHTVTGKTHPVTGKNSPSQVKTHPVTGKTHPARGKTHLITDKNHFYWKNLIPSHVKLILFHEKSDPIQGNTMSLVKLTMSQLKHPVTFIN